MTNKNIIAFQLDLFSCGWIKECLLIMTKACDISTTMVSAEFVNLEATKPFFRNTCCFKNANKFCATLLKVGFRNCKLECLSFFTENGADVSVRDIKTTVLFTSLLYRIILILSSYYWVQERLLN